jgi:PAS domain S-box-containing protein
MIGYSRRELDSDEIHLNQITPKEHWQQDAAALEQIRRTGVCQPFEKELIHKDGRRVPVLVGGASFTGTPHRGVSFVLDITERKRAEEEILRFNVHLEARVRERTAELERSKEALHELPQKIIQAQEQERRRVARELHDGVNQALASIKFRIQTAEQQIHRGDSKWQESWNRSKEMLDSVLEQVRRLSRNLRPGELDDFGLIPAMRSACQDFQERTGLELDLQTSLFEERLSPTLELSFYRIFQEALTNIEKHAKASKVAVRFEREESRVILEIEDDGTGLKGEENGNGRGGLGLLHMRERASLVGGEFSIRPVDGGGLCLRVQAPVQESLEIDNE